ncbi:unnamed protein product [Bursaphelenchus okinawaensis]|uniref:Uncharacterized protein n=1 Tax=Bursaphelenchus okinawaensis TaxID=465554 RepID=A0A811L520_9BILA|nr:unnamed protein product [Bursaphelenchus okinawaensis]CAG9119776.1 unnamed protein product [Bursaphelenchus okinawaensis]
MADSGTAVEAPVVTNNGDEASLKAADEASLKAADALAEQIQRQKDALGGFKATKVKSTDKEEAGDKSEVTEEKPEEAPEEVVAEVTETVGNGEVPTVTEGDENINDSLKSLAGSTTSTFDSEDDVEKTEAEETDKKESDTESIIEEVPTDLPEVPGLDMEGAVEEVEDVNDKTDDILQASDLNSVLNDRDDDHVVNRQACTPQTDISDSDAQKLADAQANYMLPSAFNYTKKSEANSDSDTNSEIMLNDPCKCENIRRDPKVKTKVCSIL